MISRISAYSSRRYHGAKCIPGPLKKARSLRAPKTGLNQTGSAEVGSYSADSIEIFTEACGSHHKVAWRFFPSPVMLERHTLVNGPLMLSG